MEHTASAAFFLVAIFVLFSQQYCQAERIQCGYVTINSRNALCCNGLVYARSGGQPACCGNVAYDAQYHQCCGRTIVAKGGRTPRCCGERNYDSSQGDCVEGYVQPKTTLGSTCCETRRGWICCKRGQGCCRGRSDIVAGRIQDVPGFHPTCCGINDISLKARCCSTVTQSTLVMPACCNDERVKPICCDQNGQMQCCSAVDGYCCRRQPRNSYSGSAYNRYRRPAFLPTRPTQPPTIDPRLAARLYSKLRRKSPDTKYYRKRRPVRRYTAAPVPTTNRRIPITKSRGYYPPRVYTTRRLYTTTTTPLRRFYPEDRRTKPTPWWNRPRPTLPPTATAATTASILDVTWPPCCNVQPEPYCCLRRSTWPTCCADLQRAGRGRGIVRKVTTPQSPRGDIPPVWPTRPIPVSHEDDDDDEDNSIDGFTKSYTLPFFRGKDNRWSCCPATHRRSWCCSRKQCKYCCTLKTPIIAPQLLTEKDRWPDCWPTTPRIVPNQNKLSTDEEGSGGEKRSLVRLSCCDSGNELTQCCGRGLDERGSLPKCCEPTERELKALNENANKIQNVRLPKRANRDNDIDNRIEASGSAGDNRRDVKWFGRPFNKTPTSSTCSGRRFQPDKHICCDGVLRTKINKNTECCGRIGYDASRFKCCHGRVKRVCDTEDSWKQNFIQESFII